MRYIFSFIILAALCCIASAAEPLPLIGSKLYVQTSRSIVRAEANQSAVIIIQLVTNTPVTLAARNGDWCEVNFSQVDAQGPLHGFITCSVLAAQPLTLASVQEKLKNSKLDAKANVDWTSKAFWISPSLTRWISVGVALENLYLSPATRNKEIMGSKPLRFKVAEFDAMKQLLAKGVFVDRKSLDNYTTPILNSSDAVNAFPNIKSAWSRIKMPAIKTSFFSINEVPVIVPRALFVESDPARTVALIDSLSAYNHASFQASVIEPASYVLNFNQNRLAQYTFSRFIKVSGPLDMIQGIWDAGVLKVIFPEKAFLHGVTIRGEPTKQKVDGLTLGLGGLGSCASGPMDLKTRSEVNYAKSSSALFRWSGKPIPGGSNARAQVKSRQVDGRTKWDFLISHEIDLDLDGVDDFMVWQGRYEPQVSAEGIWDAIFANINGEWKLLAYDEDSDCT